MTIVIQPRWEMEEKARIFRICVWLRPIQPPKPAEAIAIMVSRVGLREWEVRNRMVIGGNFIIVDNRRAVVKVDPWRTSGNQKWKGTSPSFIAIAVVSRRHEVGWVN